MFTVGGDSVLVYVADILIDALVLDTDQGPNTSLHQANSQEEVRL
jgi:hypothetical protein